MRNEKLVKFWKSLQYDHDFDVLVLLDYELDVTVAYFVPRTPNGDKDYAAASQALTFDALERVKEYSDFHPCDMNYDALLRAMKTPDASERYGALVQWLLLETCISEVRFGKALSKKQSLPDSRVLQNLRAALSKAPRRKQPLIDDLKKLSNAAAKELLWALEWFDAELSKERQKSRLPRM